MKRKHSTWKEPGLIVFLLLAVSLFASFTPAYAKQTDEPLCGAGFAPDYGLDYDLMQPHWTVGWENYASSRTIDQVDRVLDRLNDASIAQTMILILPPEQVSIRTNCAVHFLRYMKLGLPTGERKDNGFVFLIVVEPDDIDVHYAVGLGLPALTAYELTSINRAVEDSYESSNSLDQALLTLADEFDRVARENYPPLVNPTPVREAEELPPATPLGMAAFCGQMCIFFLILFFILWVFSQMGRGGGMMYTPSGPRSTWRRGGFPGFPSGSGGFGRSSGGGFPRMRGGSGSGRSGRTN
jgi:uncharacterized membrane protein YgcG